MGEWIYIGALVVFLAVIALGLTIPRHKHK